MQPFSIQALLLPTHAQHVVLIHFPIALFISGALFDIAAHRLRRNTLAVVAYWNIAAAACFVLPAAATGLLAWHWALHGAAFRGFLRWHVLLASASAIVILAAAGQHVLARRRGVIFASGSRLALEIAGVFLLAAAAHLGGFLSGVNAVL
jgi:uncharacterized membrane protein